MPIFYFELETHYIRTEAKVILIKCNTSNMIAAAIFMWNVQATNFAKLP